MQFSAVIGQEEIKQQLIHEITSDKISHAQLFLGKAGYGSLPLALGFAQYLFCENRSLTDSCGECSSCRKVKTLQHPDLHFSFPTVQAISKTSNFLLETWRKQLGMTPYFNLYDWIKFTDDKERKPIIGVEESLEIIKKLQLKSYEGGYKVMIVWMAEEMNTECANKLLKVLEEPTPKTIFILLAENQSKLLTTIISRTQVLRIPRLPIETIQSEIERHSIPKAAASSVAARCEGDLIEALQLIGDHEDQDSNRDLFIQMMRVCFKKNVVEMLDWSETIGNQSREAQKQFLVYALHMTRQSMLTNYTQEMLTRVSDEEAAFLSKFSVFITNNNLLDFMQLFNDAHYHIERNAYSNLLFTQLCFQVMRFIHKA